MVDFRKALEIQMRWIKWLAKPVKWVLQPLGLATYFGVIGYLIGVGLRSFPSVEIILNSGLTLMGINPQYRFPEFLGTFSAFVAYLGGLLRVTFMQATSKEERTTEVIYTDRAVQAAENPQVDLEAISDHLSLLNMRQEAKLQKAGILDLDDLAGSDPIVIRDVLGITDFMATEIISEAKDVLTGFRLQEVA